MTSVSVPLCTRLGIVNFWSKNIQHSETLDIIEWMPQSRKTIDQASTGSLTDCLRNACGFSRRFWRSVPVLCLVKNRERNKTWNKSKQERWIEFLNLVNSDNNDDNLVWWHCHCATPYKIYSFYHTHDRTLTWTTTNEFNIIPGEQNELSRLK